MPAEVNALPLSHTPSPRRQSQLCDLGWVFKLCLVCKMKTGNILIVSGILSVAFGGILGRAVLQGIEKAGFPARPGLQSSLRALPILPRPILGGICHFLFFSHPWSPLICFLGGFAFFGHFLSGEPDSGWPLRLLMFKGSSMLQQASELHSFSLLTN